VAVEALGAGRVAAQRLLQLAVGVVPRAGDQFGLAQQVHAGVTAVRPPDLTLLHQPDDDGRARRVVHAALLRVGQQLLVREQHGRLEELRRLLDHRLRVALEQRRDVLERQMGGDLAVRMAAHAVGQREETGLAGIAIPHAILVLLPAATAAHLVDGELHAFAPVFRFSSCSLRRSLKLSLV
jgi:hypothetical protein